MGNDKHEFKKKKPSESKISCLMYTGESPYKSPPNYSCFVSKDTNAV